MSIVRFKKNGSAALGLLEGDEVVDLSGVASDFPTDVAELLRADPCALSAASAKVPARAIRLPVDTVQFLPPTQCAGKIICLGLNYADHAAEGGQQKPSYPVVFFRATSSLVGHRAPLIRPGCSQQLDFEGELVAMVGRRARHVARKDAHAVIAGYSVFNDASIRDYQFKTPQWTIGKNFDGTGGFGPGFVPADRLPPGAKGLRIETRLNGDVVQSADTSDMIFDVAETVALICEAITLEPGDLLVMGTPSGVGVARKPPLWMKPGDICEVEIEGVGLLSNPVEQERATAFR
jgi:acylpyruvate hydrolase